MLIRYPHDDLLLFGQSAAHINIVSTRRERRLTRKDMSKIDHTRVRALPENICMTIVLPPGTFDFLAKPTPKLSTSVRLDGTVPERLRKMKGGISAKQLAPILGVSAVTLYRMAERKGIPSYRVGTALKFDPTAIADWLEG